MKTSITGLVLLACLSTAATVPVALAQAPMAAHGTAKPTANPMVGGAAMYANKDIIDNAVNSKDHTTLVAAVKAAGLVDTLKGPGPFTVFAPTNAAFAALPKGTVEGLLKPEKKADLSKVLTYHVVPGNLDSTALLARIKQGGGKATLTTVQGEALTARQAGKGITVTDAKGNTAHVSIADVRQSNGVIHVIDKVLMP
ncbi:fasciclin domain-containing protein [Bacillus subtilis subsp. subtilis]|nr:fasciclin domain-containing protein [Bacillus subtilis subsp. subtilis]